MSGSSRRKARLAAFQALYATDVGTESLEDCLNSILQEINLDEGAAEFAHRLAIGVRSNQGQIDAVITERAQGYSLERIAAVDRAILRLALYEVMFEEDTPHAVAINEAVELAKKYSTAESGVFINGILGGFVREEYGNSA